MRRLFSLLAALRAALVPLVVLLLFTPMRPAPAAAAPPCTVTDAGDNGPGTLRAALANSDGYANCDTINFEANLGDITVAQRLPVDRAVTVEGPASGSQVVQYGGTASATGSVFQITGGPVVLRGLTVQNGQAAGVWGGGVSILNPATALNVTLERMVVRNNLSTVGGGGIYISNGTLLIRNSIVSGNTASPPNVDLRYGGGGLYMENEYGPTTVTIDGGSQFLGNSATKSNDGGAINVHRKAGTGNVALQLDIANSTIGSVAAPNTVAENAGGGGISTYQGTVTLTDVAVVGNQAGAGGGLHNGGGTLALERTTLSENQARYYGGALFNEGTATINNSTIDANQAFGTGIGQGVGGGIANSYQLTLTNSTISGNTAVSVGGGLMNDRSNALSTLTNVTISGNEALGAGGGVVNSLGTLQLTETTVVNNVAAQGGGLWSYTVSNLPGTLTTLRQSIVAGNSAGDCATADPLLAPLTSDGYNLVGSGTGCPVGATDVPLAGALATALDPTLGAHGGATLTHALVAGSPALDLAPAPCPSGADQRGTSRPQGTACDSGAYEYGAGTPPAPEVFLTLKTSGAGEIARGPGGTGVGPFGYAPGTLVTLTPQPATGQVFVGWTVDTGYAGWANPLTITMAASHTAQAIFVPATAFPDVPGTRGDADAIAALTARGIILGYTNGTFGPDDGVQRAQMAALVARAMPAGPGTPTSILIPPACTVAGSWDCEVWPNDFQDQNGLGGNLWRDVAALRQYGVAAGYIPADCAAKGLPAPCFGPTDPVTYAQTISFITRAMVAKGYWQQQPAAPQPYAGVPAPHVADMATFAYYTGGVPAPPAEWNAQATRGWFAQALWRALDTYWGADGFLPNGQPAGGYVP